MAPRRKVFSRTVSSPSKPVPSSSREAMVPSTLIFPVVGHMMPEITFKRVDFPAPLLPTMPSRSPSSREKDTSFTAQNSLT